MNQLGHELKRVLREKPAPTDGTVFLFVFAQEDVRAGNVLHNPTALAAVNGLTAITAFLRL